MDNKAFNISYSSRKRGQQLILVGLLLIAVPLVQEHVFRQVLPYLDVVFFSLATVFFLVGFWRISQNVSYTFTIKNNVAKQTYSEHSNWNFSVNLREIREIKAQKGNTSYFIVMENSDRYPIPKIHDTNPEKIVRRLRKFCE